MKLNSFDLRAIADAVDQLAKISARIEVIELHGYIVELEYQSSQMDGTSYVVTGIEEGSKN